jgi:hypothetical protein
MTPWHLGMADFDADVGWECSMFRLRIDKTGVKMQRARHCFDM